MLGCSVCPWPAFPGWSKSSGQGKKPTQDITPEMCFIRVSSGLTHDRLGRKVAMDKRSSLLCWSVGDEGKRHTTVVTPCHPP